MKTIILILSTLILLSCNQSPKEIDTHDSTTEGDLKDIVIVKQEDKRDTTFYAKSFSYFWVVGNDTLDFKIGLTEYVGDSSVQLRIFHKNLILFSTTLDKINECLPVIQQDFNFNNLSSLYFQSPIYYPDMTHELSAGYEDKFGERNIEYQQLNEFLMNSWLDDRINGFLSQFNKSTKRYGIEKFHLLEKKHYDSYIPDKNWTDYPDFSLHGMGLSVYLEDKK